MSISLGICKPDQAVAKACSLNGLHIHHAWHRLDGSGDLRRHLEAPRQANLGLGIEVCLLPARKDDLGPMLGKCLRDRAPDSSAGPGHERNTPGQVEAGACGHG